MTLLLYQSMLCHLQLHTAPPRLPPHPRMLSYCLIERKKCVQKEQNKQNISPIEMLPDDKRSLNNREQTGDEARVVDHSDDKAYILLEMAFV